MKRYEVGRERSAMRDMGMNFHKEGSRVLVGHTPQGFQGAESETVNLCMMLDADRLVPLRLSALGNCFCDVALTREQAEQLLESLQATLEVTSDED